jgi:hypothetical protein
MDNSYNFYTTKNVIKNINHNNNNIKIVINPSFLFNKISKKKLCFSNFNCKLNKNSCYIITTYNNLSNIFHKCNKLYITYIHLYNIITNNKNIYLNNQLKKLGYDDSEIDSIYILYIEEDPFKYLPS